MSHQLTCSIKNIHFSKSKAVLLAMSLAFTSTYGYAQSNTPPPRPNERNNQPEQRGEQQTPQNTTQRQANELSPVRGINRNPPSPRPPETNFQFRTIDGTNNNVNSAEWGSTHIQLERIADADYSDGQSAEAGASRPSARLVSNEVFDQEVSLPNNVNASDFLWQWGQFLDHDIDLTDGTNPREDTVIPIPAGDVFFDPDNTGTQTLTFNRSFYDSETGNSTNNPRQQINEITAWIDASNVYGSDTERSQALRTLDGTGQLKTGAGNLLPFNETGLPNAGGSGANLFIAGDVRANEQVGLSAMHTLFVREHNRLAQNIATNNPSLNGEEIFQQARKIVAAQMQVITYREFLPLLLGRDVLRPYRGYNPRVNPNIKNEFSTAAYRFGHTLLSPTILRLDAEGNAIPQGNLSLRSAFFRPDRLITEGGIDPVLRGLASQVCQSIDSYVIDDVRNFLFGQPGQGGFDLVSLNIQRGREHGLSSYNDTRRALGLRPRTSFNQISTDQAVQQNLAAAYSNVEEVDLWVGGLAENAHRDGMLGETFSHIIRRQFESLRDGDRFWYQHALSREEIRQVERTRLSDIIRRNTDIGNEIQDNVFVVN